MKQTAKTTVVMDVLPWPDGCGFAGKDQWWQYALSQSERERLDNLLGLALLDEQVCQQLVMHRDPSLLKAFELSEGTQRWLSSIKANTLKELAEGIVAASAFHDEMITEAA